MSATVGGNGRTTNPGPTPVIDDLPVTVSNDDAMVVAQIAACLHARLDWKQADACAVDVFFLLKRKGLLS